MNEELITRLKGCRKCMDGLADEAIAEILSLNLRLSQALHQHKNDEAANRMLLSLLDEKSLEGALHD